MSTSRDYRMCRPETARLQDMLDEGLVDYQAVAFMFMTYCSESQVADMMDANELSERFTVTDEDYE